MADKKTENKTGLVRDLAEIMVELDLAEIEVKDADMRIRLSRSVGGQIVMAPAPAPAPPVTSPGIPAAPVEVSSRKGTEIPSPMVGTIYLAPSPGAPDYVSVGTKVKEGDTLLIIEAMKTMNHIPSTCSGTITEILVDDKQPVEFGQTLVVIE